jgi:hypothetical protein
MCKTIEYEDQKYTATTLKDGTVQIMDSEGLTAICLSIEDFIAELNGCEC